MLKKVKKISLNRKTILMVGFLAVVVLAAAAAISYQVYARSFDEHFKSKALSEARTQAAMVDTAEVKALKEDVWSRYEAVIQVLGSDFEHYTEDDWASYYEAFEPVKKTEAYTSLLGTLQVLAESFDAYSVYLCYLDMEWDCAMYLVDGSLAAEPCAPGTFDAPMVAEIRELMERGIYEFPVYITNMEEYGWLCTASVPVFDEAGEMVAVAYVDVSMNDVMADRAAFLKLLVGVLLAITAVLITLFGLGINRMIVGPVNQLSAAASSFVEDREKHGEEQGLSAISRLNIHTGDEIENLSDAIKQMEREINDYIDNLTKITAEKERIGAELNVATQIQADMLPSIFPAFPEQPDLDIYASMEPAKEVGGDFYDFFWIDARRLALVIADVSGKGVPAALFMVVAKTLIKNQAMTGQPVEDVIFHVNNQLCEGNREGYFVTAWVGIFDTETGALDYVNAGHNPPVLIHPDGRVEWLRHVSGLVMAAMEEMPYEPQQIKLAHGDRLYLYTDGATEAINTKEELFGEERLLSALQSGLKEDVHGNIDTVLEALRVFVGEADQFDDITMLEFEYR